MRNERFNTEKEIMKALEPADGKAAGFPLFENRGNIYRYTGEGHSLVKGTTGAGKSSANSLFLRDIIEVKESAIVVNSKNDLRERTECYAQESHRVHHIDYRNPSLSPDGLNLLSLPWKNITSGDVVKRDIGRSQIRAMTTGFFQEENKATDPFWNQSASKFSSGLINGLIEKGKPEEIHMNSVAAMMDASNQRYGTTMLIKEFANTLEADSIAKRDLAAYNAAATETRSSIHAVAANGLSAVFNSEGLMNLLCHDTLDLYNFDVESPFILYITLPEDGVYDALAGIMVSQLTDHFIRLAEDKYDGKLPIRINVILEELGAIGRSIPNLDKLVTNSRSRNIRMTLCLQSDEQLVDLYGESKAETIKSCVGITVAFATNNWHTLQELSQRCGEREVIRDGHIVKEPLITPSQIAAMCVGKALIFVGNKLKFVSQLPFYEDVYAVSDWSKPKKREPRQFGPIPTFDMRAYVQNEQKARMKSASEKNAPEKQDRIPPFIMPGERVLDPDAVLARLDSKIEQMKAEGFEFFDD